MRPTTKRILAILSLAAMIPLALVSVVPVNAVDLGYFRVPVAASYTQYDNAGEGFAHGEITVRVNSWISTSACPMEALVYWANSSGPLEGYTPLARFKLTSRTTTFEFPTMQIIPEGADRLRVYTVYKGGTDAERSSEYKDAMLGVSSYNMSAEAPEYVFGIVSDTHVQNSNSADYNVKFKDMLSDINAIIASSNAKNSETGIFINGDAIDANSQNGPATEIDTYSKVQYQNLWAMKAEASPNVPIYLAIGNHDLWPRPSQGEQEALASATNLFLQNAVLPNGSRPTSMTYDFYIGDCHFVFLGDDDIDTNYATISDEHLEWLDETIAEGYESGKTFLFLHQTLSNTVAGAITEHLDQEHNGVVNEAELRAVLRKYPDALMFSGHTHYSLNSVDASFDGGDGHMPKFFATSSVANPVDTHGTVIGNGASEGLIVEVYENKILVRGRDFKNDLWMASAQYAIEYDIVEDVPPVEEEPTEEEPEKDQSNNKKPAKDDKVEDETETDEVTDQTDGVIDGADETEDEKETVGCGSAVGVAPIAFAAVPAAFALRKKKKNDKE